MCGITGYSGKRPVDMTKIRWLVHENENRGTHATGVYAGGVLFKKAVRASEFLFLDGFNSTLKGQRTLQAHTRAATCGANNDKNAHPFIAGDPKDPWYCVGSHNGFVEHDLRGQTIELGFEKPFEVDSQLIFEALAKHKSFDILSRLDGAIACAFMFPNQDPNMLFLYKNGEGRELHLGEASDGLYYSSAAGPLHLIDCKQVWPLKPHKVYCLKEGQIVDVLDVGRPAILMSPGAKRANWRETLEPAEKVKLSKLLPERTSETNFCPVVPNKSRKLDTVSKTEGYISELRGDYNKLLALIAQCAEDLKTMEVEKLTSIKSSVGWDYDDHSSGLLLVKLLDDVQKKPLIAWAIFAEENIEIAGMTSISGCAVLKFPYKYCGKEVVLKIYDVTETLEAKSFTVEVPAASVSEVTLLIPFRKRAKQQTAPTKTSIAIREKISNKSRPVVDTVYASSPFKGGVHASSTGENSGVVREQQSKQLRGSRAERQDNEQALEPAVSTKGANSNSGNKVRAIQEQLGFFKASKTDVINSVISGKYKPDAKLLESELKDPIVWDLKVNYQAKLGKELLVYKLIDKAVHLRAYDLEHNHGMALSVVSYVKDLLVSNPFEFATEKSLIHGYVDTKKWYPENVLKANRAAYEVLAGIEEAFRTEHQQTATTAYMRIEEDRMPVKHYQEYLQTKILLNNADMAMVKEKEFMLQSVKKHKTIVDDSLKDCRKAIDLLASPTSDQLPIKEFLLKFRNFLSEESRDLRDYTQLLQNQINAKAKAAEES